MQKELIIIGGPNGAGKSTLAGETVTRTGYPFLNADVIASELSPDTPEDAAISGGRVLLDEIKSMMKQEASFILESTLSGQTLARRLEEARRSGYSIEIRYVFLNSADECLRRVQERTKKGGHSIPEDDIRRRFARSMLNFWEIYRPLSDSWVVVYNSGTQPQEIVFGDSAGLTVLDKTIFRRFNSLLDRLGNG